MTKLIDGVVRGVLRSLFSKDETVKDILEMAAIQRQASFAD